MWGRPRRLALLAEGRFTPTDAKTAVGVLRYRPEEVAAVIDSTRAGGTAAERAGVGGAVPVVTDVAAAAAAGADSLLIGVAPQGGELPAAWRASVLEALGRGWDVLSGLHAFLADDPEFAAAAARTGARIHDARRPPTRRPVAAGRAAALEASVVLTVGSDCNVGKMTAAVEIVRALEARGERATFVATGQTGMFIAGQGVTVDAVPSDFVAGFTEELVLEAARTATFVVVEGQGSLNHPAYSGVALSLLHGACPSLLVLCHHAGRTHLRLAAAPGVFALPSLAELVEAYEQASRWVRLAVVAGIALNTLGLADSRARAACEAASRESGLPATDPVRFGAGPLAEALVARRRNHAPPS
jgi:uncharacterized NAD-dependent epimerase/dehydratase family protein